MNDSIGLIIFLVVGAPIVLVIWLVLRAVDSRRKIEDLARRLGNLENEVHRLKSAAVETISQQQPKEALAPALIPPHEPIPVPAIPPPPPPRRVAMPAPPLPTATISATAAPSPKAEPMRPIAPPPEQKAEPEPAPVFAKAAASINWEQFMGVKMFAWGGGLALFLGVAFFIKYAFDNNLVPPWLRAALGFLIGLSLLVGGVLMSRKDYRVLSQTLCATGVVVLYAVTFACRALYGFPFFSPVSTFLLMVLVTAVAFLLADRFNALVVAILGMLGGFLTPILLSTGQDNPFGLFGYIAILDAGLLMVAVHRRWDFLTGLAAFATVVMEIGWADKFFVAGKYFDDNKIFTAMGVLLTFQVLYLAANGWAKRRQQASDWLAGSGFGLGIAALMFTAWFLTFPPLAARPSIIFSFIFIIDALVAALVLLNPKIDALQPVTGLAVFGLLGYWTADSLNNELLNIALVFYFVFAVFHSAFPLVLRRRFGLKGSLWAGHIFPALALGLVLLPVFKFTEISFIIWPFVLLVDLLAIALAVLLRSIISVLIVLLLTLTATGALIFKIPAELTGMPVSFFLLGAFAVFFVAASVWLWRKVKPAVAGAGDDPFAMGAGMTAQLPILASVLPFLLLIMAALRLRLANPSPLFGLALLLTVLLFGVARILVIDALPAVGLASVAALECAWHFNCFTPDNATVPLVWYVVYYVIFTILPFVFLRSYEGKTVPWATAALAGLPQFFLVHRLIAAAHPNNFMGVVPTVFALPPLLSLVIVLRKISAATPARLNQLAWFGGVALFFITLIFPIQFDRQWITIGWALEGTALLWLFHRVPHPGLRLTGVGLLAAAFARLALNPAIFEYYARSATPIFNWYLYSYGIVTVCLLAGARLTAPPRHLIGKLNAPGVLYSLGTVLAFYLLNIEIADYFSPPGSMLRFEFGGNFAREMTYTISWAVFALILLVVGIARKIPPSRYAAMGLLSVTLLKLFLHDLSQLGALYRIAAFIAVAIIAMLASFAYQRFYATAGKPKDEVETIP